jgi:Arc/MetJ-type ribon-helix-helix transcriptional regulator
MSGPTTLTVRIGPEHSAFVAQNVGDPGTYENVSEYIRDLIRRDRERIDEENFQRLKAELTLAFAAPVEDYVESSAQDIITRLRPSE